MTSTVLIALNAFSHLILTMTLQSRLKFDLHLWKMKLKRRKKFKLVLNDKRQEIEPRFALRELISALTHSFNLLYSLLLYTTDYTQ